MIPPLAAFRLDGSPKIALVGAGGKTRLMFQLARSFETESVLVTSTTHLATNQASLADHHFRVHSGEEVDRVAADLPPGVVLLSGTEIAGEDRIAGLNPAALAAVRSIADRRHLPLVIEADGSRQRPVKAPAEHEPAVPEFVDVVLVLAGLRAIGQPLGDEWVHRPSIFSELSGIKMGEPLTKEGLSRVLVSPSGGLKKIPPRARRVACLTQAAWPAHLAQAADLANRLLPTYQAVLVVDLDQEQDSGAQRSLAVTRVNQPVIHAVYERIAGIILAAGGSSRFGGSAKQLLDWEGMPLVRKVAGTALQAHLDPVIVVTGAQSEEVEQAVADETWVEGQSSSVRAGLAACPADIGGALFLLVDQPQIPFTLLRSLVEAHYRSRAPIVAPQIDGARGNPVLFDRDTFLDIESLEGDKGGRVLFSRYPVEWVLWHDPRMLLDIDSLDDYRRLVKEMETG
jgi:molybdenum cofactor cytidylyltransferase